MSSENPTVSGPTVATPENQQERLATGWVVGFVDGEGCFSCPIYRNPTMKLGWQVRPEFAVVQSASSRSVLEDLISFFGCGKIYLNRRHDTTVRISSGIACSGGAILLNGSFLSLRSIHFAPQSERTSRSSRTSSQ